MRFPVEEQVPLKQGLKLHSYDNEENIAYGKLNATINEIIGVAKLANTHKFIMELPDTYEHRIGERSIKLSVGNLYQAQYQHNKLS